MEALSNMYGWTPNQIKEMDVEDITAYTAILEGRHGGKEGIKSPPNQNAPMPKNVKRKFR